MFLIFLNTESLKNGNDDCLIWNYLLKSFAWQSTVIAWIYYSKWCPQWLPDYHMSDSMLQPFNWMWLLKQVIFDNSLVEKKTFMLHKTTIREVQNMPTLE